MVDYVCGRCIELLRKIITRKRPLATITTILILSIAVSLGSYEAWRSSVESQIQSRIDSMNSSDQICSYIISNSNAMPYYETRFYPGHMGINKTRLSDWQSVTDYAYTRLNTSRTQLGCKIWFGLTRTLLVLLGPSHSQMNGWFNTQDVIFATYAPF